MLIFPLLNDLSRKIIHIDMDAFFAAVEIRDNPQTKKGNPLLLVATQEKQEVAELFRLVVMKREPLASTQL